MSNIKEARIKINSELYEVEASLFSDGSEDVEFFESENDTAEPEILEINTVGKICCENDRITVSYEESEATGMEGSLTSLTFLKSDPGIVTMTRSGMISTTLVFEEGKRHHCIYKTPFMPFEVCIHTTKVVNLLSVGNTLELDYVVEIRGAKAERTKFKMQIL